MSWEGGAVNSKAWRLGCVWCALETEAKPAWLPLVEEEQVKTRSEK